MGRIIEKPLIPLLSSNIRIRWNIHYTNGTVFIQLFAIIRFQVGIQIFIALRNTVRCPIHRHGRMSGNSLQSFSRIKSYRNCLCTHEKINRNNLKKIPLRGVTRREASQKALRTHARPSNPWLIKGMYNLIAHEVKRQDLLTGSALIPTYHARLSYELCIVWAGGRGYQSSA